MRKSTIVLAAVATGLLLWIGVAVGTLMNGTTTTPADMEEIPITNGGETGVVPTLGTNETAVVPPRGTVIINTSVGWDGQVITNTRIIYDKPSDYPTPEDPTHQAIWPTHVSVMETARAMDPTELAVSFPTAVVRCGYDMAPKPTCGPDDIWMPGEPTWTIEPQP